MGHDFIGLGAVNHGRQHHQGVGPEFLGIRRQPGGQRRRIFGHTDHHRHPSGRRGDRFTNQGPFFFGAQGAAFSDGAGDDQAVDAVLDKGVDDLRRGCEIERKIICARMKVKIGRKRSPAVAGLRTILT